MGTFFSGSVSLCFGFGLSFLLVSFFPFVVLLLYRLIWGAPWGMVV